MDEFFAYLKAKRIDPNAFKAAQPARFAEWVDLFAQMHPDSFTQQKLFLINGIRRTFPLPESEVAALKAQSAAAKAARPKPSVKRTGNAPKPPKPLGGTKGTA